MYYNAVGMRSNAAQPYTIYIQVRTYMCTSTLKDPSQYCLYLIMKQFETENNRPSKL